MTRTRGDQILVKPANDVYTALTGAACVVVLIAIIALFTRSSTVFGDSLFFPSGNVPGATR